MAKNLSNDLIDTSFLSIFDQWWCPICSDCDFLCEVCQQIIMQLDDATSKNESSKTAALFSQYMLNTKHKREEQDEIDGHSGSNQEETHVLLINSEVPVAAPLAFSPPPPACTSLTVRDRRHAHESGAKVIFDKIFKYCEKNNINFIDDRFPPSATSIGKGSFSQVAKWLRISDVAPSSSDDRKLSWNMFSSPEPSDIAQGALGNCWLVAALALVSEKPRLLEHILLTKQINKVGVYMVRICHNGLWKSIIVDDSFPCTKHNHLVFTQAKRRQLYVPLIEKACAKLFGSYAALQSGNMREGLQLLTGASCDYVDLHPKDSTVDSDLIWTKLLSSCNSKLLVGVSSGGTGVSSAEYARVRIHKDHAFSVLVAHALDDGVSRFVLVRDPHSHSNYRDESVTENILQKLYSVHPARRSTGAFWISWPLFLRYFSSITISHYDSDQYDIREEGRFTRSSTQYVMAYHFDVPTSSSINISLIHHRRDRTTRSQHTQAFVLCDAAEYEATRIVGTKKSVLMCKQGGHTYWTGFLKAGCYVLVPFSTSFWQSNKQTRDFTVVIHSNVQLKLIIKSRPATFLTDCIISAVIKNSKKIQEKEAVFYTTSSKIGLKFLVVENRSVKNYLYFDMTLRQAQNIRHSRHIGTPHGTHDCIPPLHRQIICAMEWIMREGESASMSYSESYHHEKHQANAKPHIDVSARDLHSPRAF